MNRLGCGCAAALLAAILVPAPRPAMAAGCVNGAYRAGCAGPNGAVGVRKAPYHGGAAVYHPPGYHPPVYHPPVYHPPVYHAPLVYHAPVVVAPRPPVVVVPPQRPVVVIPAN